MSEYAQKKDGWCGPAALSYALHLVGIDVPQEALVKESGTTVGEGVDPSPLKKAAEKHKAKVEIVNGESTDETLIKLKHAIKDGAAVIVDYLVSGKEDGGHYVVLLDVKGNDIRLFDPSGGKIDTMTREYFTKNWMDKTESGKQMKNWAMILRA